MELVQRLSREQELGKERDQRGLSTERTLALAQQEGSKAWALLAVCRVPMSEGWYPLEESKGRRVRWEGNMASMLELSVDQTILR